MREGKIHPLLLAYYFWAVECWVGGIRLDFVSPLTARLAHRATKVLLI